MFWIFEILCVTVLAIATLVLARTSASKRLSIEYTTACVAAWICEHTAIEFYDFYHYDTRWTLFLGHVPLLIALIWPLVILYAERVATETNLRKNASPLRAATTLALWVCLDASFVEVVSVEAGFWRWTHPGYLHVPLIGIIGWGVFAFSFSWSRVIASKVANPWLASLTRIASTFALTHALLLTLYWAAFRWIDFALPNETSFAFFAAACVLAASLWKSDARLQPSTAAPRILATLLFTGVAVFIGLSWPAWCHFTAVALIYLVATFAPKYRTGAAGA